jgi:hypothetical protein
VSASPNSVWPPLQTQSGRPRSQSTSSNNTQVSVPQVSAPQVSAPQVTPVVGQGTTPIQAAPAQMLEQVQCPVAQPGLVCFEAATNNGTAATMPPAASLPNLPVVSSPGLSTACPNSSSSSGDSTSSSSPDSSGSGDDSDSGSSSGSGGGGHDGGGDDDDDGSSKHSGGHKHKHKHKSSDNDDAMILPANDADAIDTVSSCGLLDQTVGSAGSTIGSATSGLSHDKDLITGALSKIPTGSPENVQLRTTGYSYQDNTPPNSNTVSCGTIHKVASGDGTYNDPISVAVPGHGGKGAQIPCGTRIYYKPYQFYGIVEDTGATDFSGQKHTDIWVDGRGYSKGQSDKCMDPITKNSIDAILNPPPNLPTRTPGPITQGSNCNVGSGGGSSDDSSGG